MKTIMIQNKDRNVSSRDYADFDGKLLITTTFRTLQGEGVHSGRPAIFLRLAGCNYGSKEDMCSWCDTLFQFDKGEALSPDEVLVKLLQIEGYRSTDMLVITGGEPTLQMALLSLISKAMVGQYFSIIQVETNGTQPRFFETAQLMGLLGKGRLEFVVSPKANERLKKYPAVAPQVKWWANAFKFVISADPESAHHEIPSWALNVTPSTIVMVSPMTVYRKSYAGEVSSIWDAELVDQEQTAANYAYAAQYALKHSLRLSVQVHTLTAIP